MQNQTQITPFGATEDGNHICQIADQIGGSARVIFAPIGYRL
jgi:hypothetical protein